MTVVVNTIEYIPNELYFTSIAIPATLSIPPTTVTRQGILFLTVSVYI